MPTGLYVLCLGMAINLHWVAKYLEVLFFIGMSQYLWLSPKIVHVAMDNYITSFNNVL